MASKDTSLFTAPRASHFDLLMSDDEVSEDATLSTPAVEQEDISAANESSSHEQPTAEADGDDWACFSKKATSKKSSNQSHQTSGSKAFPAHSTAKPHHAGHKKGPYQAPLTIEQLTPDMTIEVFDFPATWRTSDLKKLFANFEGQYRLKWQSDTSCWFHFNSAELAAKAMAEVSDENAKLRPFSAENVLPPTPKVDTQGITPEVAFELSGFPSTWHATEINNLLAAFAGKYRIKWRHDSQVWIIFDEQEVKDAAMAEVAKCPQVKVGPFVPPVSN